MAAQHFQQIAKLKTHETELFYFVFLSSHKSVPLEFFIWRNVQLFTRFFFFLPLPSKIDSVYTQDPKILPQSIYITWETFCTYARKHVQEYLQQHFFNSKLKCPTAVKWINSSIFI